VRYFLTGPLVRLFPVGLCMLAIQRTVLTEVQAHGVVFQIVLALSAAIGAGAGSERGALGGFTLGMMYDLATGSPLGLTALVYGLAGFVAGYVLTLTPTPPWWLASIFAAIGAAVGETAVPVARMLVGQDGWFTSELFVIVPIVAAFALVLSPGLVPLGRWCMCVKKPKWKAMHE
jgi:cell shape-determining protein MreD